MKTDHDVFICYAHEDRPDAMRLAADLEKAGLTVWLDTLRLLPGQNWQHEIPIAIQRSRTFLLLISEKSSGKVGFAQKELRTALEVLDTFPDDVPYLIPVRLADLPLTHPRVRQLHSVDLFQDWSFGLQKIVATMKLLDGLRDLTPSPATSTEPKQVAPLVRAYVLLTGVSNTWDETLKEWAAIPDVTEVAMILGNYDVMVTVDSHSYERMNEVTQIFRSNRNVSSTTTIMAIKRVK